MQPIVEGGHHRVPEVRQDPHHGGINGGSALLLPVITDAACAETSGQSTADPDGRGIRVGFLSKLDLLDVHQIAAFPTGLRPIQVDDTPTAEAAMGRPALAAGVITRTGTRIDLITCHLKSKLLTFPRWSVLHPR